MKPATLSLIALLCLSTACKKASHNTSYSDSIEGTWELRKIVANLTLDYSTGNGNLLKLTQNEYEIYENNTLTGKGTYSIVTDNTLAEKYCMPAPAGVYSKQIVYDGNIDSVQKELFQISGNTLKIVFSRGCSIADADGQREYVRK